VVVRERLDNLRRQERETQDKLENGKHKTNLRVETKNYGTVNQDYAHRMRNYVSS
jgi:hypothetical protein